MNLLIIVLSSYLLWFLIQIIYIIKKTRMPKFDRVGIIAGLFVAPISLCLFVIVYLFKLLSGLFVSKGSKGVSVIKIEDPNEKKT